MINVLVKIVVVVFFSNMTTNSQFYCMFIAGKTRKCFQELQAVSEEKLYTPGIKNFIYINKITNLFVKANPQYLYMSHIFIKSVFYVVLSKIW